ncbi:urate hydroxylase PuuD [Vreelandella venusta]|uniref:Urate hydroxylase PuuD n=1 Tax=Vreelandella venusta TaxID=44935 RepID=A0AAP9ZD76_9GAMM|nr:urate hydroxylase PuuD [Halomonas venusta]MDW0359680.1 urate hydroxylase PuuD [Halomonas venusta]MDX1355574.1 urate hydroxylase PuuD [Halomonas venusta]QRL02584.1 urate hydroxylase PuuD [Halomonas venusta]UQI39863.1 urate hydroxylase PuuD [Halomonas venusta]WAM54899.1 urate hydroxylase PuuD [Halomonas venusta]
MQTYIVDFANLLLRWLHVIAAIAWIGESIYFVMLDNGLRTPKAAEDREKGVFGEMWAVHGGGFYHNQKYATAPAKLPNDLHWSFWKAYTTWLSGFALFVILYMANPGFYLVNPNSNWAWAASMTGWQANLLALAFLLGGWVVYNELCKRISPNMNRDGLLSVAVALMMIVVAYLSTQMFTGRAAFLLTGAVMATAMSANVFFWIIPGQRRMVKAMKAGEAPNPLDGKRGKQRSVHNTYFTLPVVLLMVSNHYSFIYSHELSWVVMVLFIFAGALIRQFFVLMHAGKTQPAYPAVGIGLILLAFWVAAPSPGAGNASASGTPSQAQISGLIDQHCSQCHARNPEHAGFSAPPAGYAFDTWDEILGHQAQIKQVVASRYMPLGNITNMSDEERDSIAAWEE